MTNRNSFSYRRACTLVGFVASLGLVGCLPPDTTIQDYSPFSYGNWRQIPQRPDVHVEFVKLKHFADFQPQAVRLDATQRGHLQGFIAEGNLRQGDRVQIQVPLTAGPLDPVTKARADHLRGELNSLGLPTSVVGTSALPSGSNQVAVVVDRAMAIPPDCDAPEPFIANRPDYRIGCAYNSALGLMVADPRDLVRGQPLDPADAEVTARGIEGYRSPADREQDDGGITIEATSDN